MENRLDHLTVEDVLGPTGSIARRLAKYELRGQQIEMARQVENSLSTREPLMVEAGTGVGKSFAYLVPAILQVTGSTESANSKQLPIVISTHTISLQEQLITKDIPFLNSVIAREFSAVLVKGRGNYLSRRRLQTAQERAGNLFAVENDFHQLKQVVNWAKSTVDGSLSDLDFRPETTVWEEVGSDSSNCMGRNCSAYDNCFYYRARRRWQHTQLLIVNHALFFSDLALRMVNVKLLPDYQAVIFDEAHTIPAVASQHLGGSVSLGQVDYTLTRLYNDRTNKGLLVHDSFREPQQLVDRCRLLADEFFCDVADWLERNGSRNSRVQEAEIVPDRISPALSRLATSIRQHASQIENTSRRHDYASAAERLSALAGQIQQWLFRHLDSAVYWIELGRTKRGRRRISLELAPLDIGPAMRQQLFSQVPSVIMTSATMTAGGDSGFEFFKSRVGLTSCQSSRLGSPFDYQRQAKLVLVRGMPDPNTEKEEFLRLSVEAIKQYAGRTQGCTIVLFTSYVMLRSVAEKITPWLGSENLQLYSQADGTPRAKLLDQFKRNPQGVLLGTDSFWQGVDVPGDALKTVIITKLPFSVPDHPLLEARLEAIRESGGNPFGEYQLPEAVIKFRQGFGRLIRTQADEGTVVVLDPRIHTKSYGPAFVAALPKCEIIEEVVGESERSF